MRMKSKNCGEAERLKALHAYDILDTPSELEFDDLTALAAQICQTPIALISLLDQTRQWFKSKVGLTVSETPKSIAFCLHTIQSDLPLVVKDALLDKRFANNPLVTGEPNIRCYVGVPLIVPSGHRIGSLCVIAPVPMQLTEGQIRTLQALSRQVVNLLELKRSNRLLAERKALLRSFFDSAPMMMGVVELLEDDILHLSDNAETARLFGIKPDEMQNRRASEMGVPTNHIRQWIAHYLEAQKKHQPQKFEYPHETEAGQRWLSATVVAVEHKEGQPARFAYIVEDISDRKEAKEKLKQSEQKFRAIFDGTFQFIGLLNPAGILIEANRPALEAIGVTLADVVGQPFWATPWWTHSPTLQTQLKQAISRAAQGEFVRFESKHILANETSIFIDFSIQPIVDDAGNVIMLIPEGRDISDRKRVEAEILKSLEKERELNAFKTRFITMVSHEYRTPLATILSSIDLLEYYGHCSTEQEREEYCKQIRNSIQRMTDLLNDVLTVEKSEAGKFIFNPEPLDLKQFCQDLVTELQGNIKTEHRILLAIEGQCSQAQMDKKLMHHIFSNLISNAVKYSPQGGIIRFKVICQDQIATFCIQDQGIGIPPEAIQNLFQSFFRASNVGNIAGSGLGLSIVKRLVESHAGSISVESQLGTGTTFVVALPLKPDSLLPGA